MFQHYENFHHQCRTNIPIIGYGEVPMRTSKCPSPLKSATAALIEVNITSIE